MTAVMPFQKYESQIEVISKLLLMFSPSFLNTSDYATAGVYISNNSLLNQQ